MFRHRLVHIDLKGAPLRLDYWQQLMPFLSKMGINGLLIEYEDMFPFEDYLSAINCEDVYSTQQIETIIGIANKWDLKIIPLIQTFGHLEFVLKHEVFKHLREVEAYPNSICPSNDKSLELIKDMIRQMVSMHQKWTQLESIHIGCDEVWHLGHCSQCLQYIQHNSERNKTKLFIDFVSKISGFVRKTFGINVIIWDDMIRETDNQYIIETKFNDLVEPMVWHYLDLNFFQLKEPNFWNKYKQLFARIWIASAFKGASKMNQIIPPISYHISNQMAWIKAIDDNQISNIEGVALTGWQRFDHFTTLCELLPNAIISLLMCLSALNQRTFNREIQEKASHLIGSNKVIEIEIKCIDDIDFEDTLYPGARLYKLCIEWMFLINDFNCLRNNQSLEGAFTSYQISRNRTNPLHIQSFLLKARILLFRVNDMKIKLESEMKEIFFDTTIDEWIQTNVNPIVKKLEKIVTKADQQIAFHLNSNHI